MRRSTAAFVATIIAAMVIPAAGRAAAECAVVWDPAGDVAGPLGTPRPAQLSGANVDLTGVSMQATRSTLHVSMTIRDLTARQTAGTDGAFYAVFWSIGNYRYFAQASRLADTGWSYQAGHAAGIDDRVPQQGLPVSGGAGRGLIRIDVPLPLAGGPAAGELLQQVRARSEESALRANGPIDPFASRHVAALSDAAGGLEGGRFLYGGECLGLLSPAGERCVVAVDSPLDAQSGQGYNLTRGTDAANLTRGTALGPIDPATEILSLQMGANTSTLVVEVAVASLRRPVPDGAEAERWETSWMVGNTSYVAFAERRSNSYSFGYWRATGEVVPTSGSISRATGTIRILVPRHEAGAGGLARLVAIAGRAEILMPGGYSDPRDTAGGPWATQFVAGVTCAEQEKAACPVVLDAVGDAAIQGVPQDQPASDIIAGGAAGPANEIVLSLRVPDIGAPIPDGFDLQGWTISWAWGGKRYYAQAERTARETVFRYGIAGDTANNPGPTGATFAGSVKADGSFDVRAGVVSVIVPRNGVGLPPDGVLLTELGARSWVMKYGNVATPAVPVDETPLAPYRVGLGCSA